MKRITNLISLLLLAVLLLLTTRLHHAEAAAVPDPEAEANPDCENSGYGNSGCNNSGIGNVGVGNSGIQNVGTGNSGIRNCGINQSGVGQGCDGDDDDGYWLDGVWISGIATTTWPAVVTVTEAAIGAVVTVTHGTVVGRRTDCAYWRAQGYTCDSGVKDGVQLGVLAGGVLVGMAGVFWGL